jgi:hypothetical protein
MCSLALTTYLLPAKGTLHVPKRCMCYMAGDVLLNVHHTSCQTRQLQVLPSYIAPLALIATTLDIYGRCCPA